MALHVGPASVTDAVEVASDLEDCEYVVGPCHSEVIVDALRRPDGDDLEEEVEAGLAEVVKVVE